jgi:hypothetical protein
MYKPEICTDIAKSGKKSTHKSIFCSFRTTFSELGNQGFDSPTGAYSVAAEPQFRSGVSHQSGTTEPSFRLFEPLTI